MRSGLGNNFDQLSRVALGAWTPSAVGLLNRWLDIGGRNGMFTDAGTTPATAVDDLIYRLAARNDPSIYLDQSNSDRRPPLKQGANGIWYLNPDGIDDCLQTTSGTLSQTNTVAFLWIPSGATGHNNDERVIDGGTGDRQIIDGTGITGNKVWRYYAGSVQNSSQAYANATAYRVIATMAGASSELMINGSVVSTANPGTASLGGLTLFMDNALTTSVAAGGKMSQYCDFNGALSGGDKTLLDAWLATQVPT